MYCDNHFAGTLAKRSPTNWPLISAPLLCGIGRRFPGGGKIPLNQVSKVLEESSKNQNATDILLSLTYGKLSA